MVPARLPSGSSTKIRVPTVGIVTFGITILAPIFSMAAIRLGLAVVKKLRRPSGLEAPAEDLFVDGFGAIDIISVDA